MALKLRVPIHSVMSCFSLVAVLLATQCNSWNVSIQARRSYRNPLPFYSPKCRNSELFSQPKCDDQQEQSESSDRTRGITRRNVFFESMIAAHILFGIPNRATASSANGIVTVRIESQKDSLGVEIYDTTLRGKNIVAIRRIVVPNKNNQLLMEGMVLRPRNGGNIAAKDLVQTLKSGPFPIEIDFVNLAAGGDAISDMGTSLVTPKDALELAKNTEDSANSNNILQQQKGGGYSITTLQETQRSCAIRSRRNDVLEIEYEASYITGEESGWNKKVLYDASAFRGTGNRPYQMVLGSGDMIPGVDQGLYDMCPGEKRLLTIPPLLGHGPNSRKLYRIPDNYKNLEWKVSLVTIDSTIREDNNDVSREDRESRFAY